MNDFNAELNIVLKYSGRLRSREEWEPIVTEYLDNHKKSEGAEDEHTPQVLADFLQDEGDPRAELLRRNSKMTGWAENQSRLRQDGFDTANYSDHYVKTPFGNLLLTVYPSRRSTVADKLELGLEFGNSTQNRGIHRYFDSTPEEVRELLRHFPDEHRTPAEKFLNRHFPEPK